MMTKYARFDEIGLPLAFFTTDIHGERLRPVYSSPMNIGDDPVQIGDEPNPDCKIPVDAVAITDEQWMEFLENQGQRRWNGSGVEEYTTPLPAITTGDVNAERQRRILAGTTVDGIRVTGNDNDTRNLMGLALGAQLRLAGGDNETITTFRDADNVDHDLTPEQILNLWQKSAAHVSMMYQKSWDIKAMEPIPENFTNDEHWN